MAYYNLGISWDLLTLLNTIRIYLDPSTAWTFVMITLRRNLSNTGYGSGNPTVDLMSLYLLSTRDTILEGSLMAMDACRLGMIRAQHSDTGVWHVLIKMQL